jgi:hypothetical protein
MKPHISQMDVQRVDVWRLVHANLQASIDKLEQQDNIVPCRHKNSTVRVHQQIVRMARSQLWAMVT